MERDDFEFHALRWAWDKRQRSGGRREERLARSAVLSWTRWPQRSATCPAEARAPRKWSGRNEAQEAREANRKKLRSEYDELKLAGPLAFAFDHMAILMICFLEDVGVGAALRSHGPAEGPRPGFGFCEDEKNP